MRLSPVPTPPRTAWMLRGASPSPCIVSNSKHGRRPKPRAIPPRDASTARPVPLAPRIAALTHEVHGYHPYWMGASYLVYNWSRLSTIAFFGLELDGTGAVANAHAWPWNGLVTTAHENGVRVLVTAICQSTTALDALLGSAINRQARCTNIVSAVMRAAQRRERRLRRRPRNAQAGARQRTWEICARC